MRVLILEDDQNRVNTFVRELKNVDRDITASSKIAINLVKKVKYDVIFLDHDLGIVPETGEKTNDVYLISGEYTGYEVAQAIPQSINKDTFVVIHSYNRVGAEKMQSVLDKCDYAPFGGPSFNKYIEKIKNAE